MRRFRKLSTTDMDQRIPVGLFCNSVTTYVAIVNVLRISFQIQENMRATLTIATNVVTVLQNRPTGEYTFIVTIKQ